MNKKSVVVGLLGLGAIGGLVGTSSAQFISLDGVTEPIVVKAKSNDVTLTADFTEASLKEVVQWMKRVGLDFVADPSVTSTDRRVALHFKEASGHEVIESVACAFGLDVVMDGDSYVLGDPSAAAPVAIAVSEVKGVALPEEMVDAADAAATVDPQDEQAAKQAAESAEAMAKAVAEAESAADEAEAATDLATAKAAAKRAAQAARRAAEMAGRVRAFRPMALREGKRLKLRQLEHTYGFSPFSKGEANGMPFVFDSETLKGLEELRNLGKSIKIKIDGKELQGLDAEALKHLKEKGKEGRAFTFTFDGDALKGTGKDGKARSFSFEGMDIPGLDPEAFKMFEGMGKDGKAFGFSFDGREFKGLDGKPMKMPEGFAKRLEEMKKQGKAFKFEFKGGGDWEKHMEKFGEHGRLWAPAPDVPSARAPRAPRAMPRMDARAFLESMTPAQKKTMKDRGFLKLSELSTKQRSMLGDPKGQFQIHFSVNGESVKIQGEGTPAPAPAPERPTGIDI